MTWIEQALMLSAVVIPLAIAISMFWKTLAESRRAMIRSEDAIRESEEILREIARKEERTMGS